VIQPIRVAALGFLLFVAGCPSPDRAQDGVAVRDTPGAAMITPTPDALRVPLQPVGESGITGEVTLREVGGQSSVQFTVLDAPANSVLEVHIHQGSCAQPGPVAAHLDPIITDPAGLGTSVTTVELPIATLADGEHYAEAHEPGDTEDQPGATLACADIPARAG
jgi:hypothetical protein